jgi:hypothetical protein
MKRLIAFLILGAFACAQTQPTFKGHQIGETAQQFFTIAQMAEHNGQLTTDYCKWYLSDPKTLQAYEMAQKNNRDLKSMNASSDVKGCRQVQVALDGRDAEVGNRYAHELGSGAVTFHGGKLVALNFSPANARYDDVVADMTRKLAAEPKNGQDTYQNAFGGTLVMRNAIWITDRLITRVSEQKSFRYGDLGASVIVGDRAYLDSTATQKQASRPNTLD